MENEAFKSDGKIIIDPGWLAVYGKQAATDDEQTLCAVIPGETAQTEEHRDQTKPRPSRPPASAKPTLLSAMEGAGKLVEDEDLRDAMSQRGLGTPATRAQIIEGLLFDGYLNRQGRDLIVTQKGLSLINLLRGIGIQSLTSPEMTGEWEFKLKQMEQGGIPRPQFMEEIRHFTEDIVAQGQELLRRQRGGAIHRPRGQLPEMWRTRLQGILQSLRVQRLRACWSGKTWPAANWSARKSTTLLEKGSRGPAGRLPQQDWAGLSPR